MMPGDESRATGEEIRDRDSKPLAAGALPPRVSSLRLSQVGAEALDDPSTDPLLVGRMLRDIVRSNRWLGGTAAMRYGLLRLLQPADRGRTLTLFDIGTGAGDLPIDAQRTALARGVTLLPVALERIRAAARIARQNGVPVVLGCAGELPLRERSVDIVLLSQVAHHLDTGSVIQLFASASAIARRGVIVADLRPMLMAGASFRAAGAALRFHPTTIRDGVTSLRRGYRPEALRWLVASAGVTNASIVALPLARLVAWWRTDGS